MSTLFIYMMDFFYLDNYKSLPEKWKDPDRETLRGERRAAYEMYRESMRAAWKDRDFNLLKALKRAKKEGDYIGLYTLEMAMRGDYWANQRIKNWEF